MPRLTENQKLRQESAALRAELRKNKNVLQHLVADRNRIMNELGEARQWRVSASHLEKKVAHLEGYIDRVREVDGITAPVQETPREMALERKTTPIHRQITAEDVANMPEAEFNKLLEHPASLARLERIMGRDDD